MKAFGIWASCCLASCALHGSAYGADQPTNAPGSIVQEIGKKPFELGGYGELKEEVFRLNQGSPFYDLNFPNPSGPGTQDRTTGTLQLLGKYRQGTTSFNFLTNSDVSRNQTTDDHNNRIFEAYLSLKAGSNLTFEAGKKALAWGKGYAWNPVGFIQRPKDPNDPTLAREGYTFVAADFIRSFTGQLQTVAFTPVLLPVSSGLNGDFGKPDRLNAAGKLYFLYRDTDIDLLYSAHGSKPSRLGFDFSRNVGSNLEVHGEWAHLSDAQKQVVSATGNMSQQQASVLSYLMGVRYLTEKQTTYIVEYYHNGAGFSGDNAANFYRLAGTAVAQYQATGNTALLQRAQSLSQSAYGGPNPFSDYLYFRVSQQDPFGVVYLTPAITLIANLKDGSFSMAPELLYTGFKNLELRARVFWLKGDHDSDFGSKQNTAKLEMYARYYF